LKNPYIIHRPLTAEDMFFGRESQFEQLTAHLLAGRRLLLLYGQRTIGKTSFLNHLPSRLGARYKIRHVGVEPRQDEHDLLWAVLVALGCAWEHPEPNREAYTTDPDAYTCAYLAGLPHLPDAPPTLFCLDAIAVTALADESGIKALTCLQDALATVDYLVLVIAVEGYPAEHGLIPEGIPKVLLGPLDEDDAENLLTVPVRGVIAYDYEAIRRVYNLSGGQPLFVQFFGQILFEQRVEAGWASLPEVEQAASHVVAFANSQFQERWEACKPVARVVLSVFPEMIGKHGIASFRDISSHLSRLGIQITVAEIEGALVQLTAAQILERLGGETYRIRSELFRSWLRQNHTAVESARLMRRYRRAPVRRISPLQQKRVDWLGVLLWMIAGLLAVFVAFTWRSRQKGIVWTVTPTATSVAVPTDMAPESATTMPITQEAGVALGHILYMGKQKPEDHWGIYIMRSDGSDPAQITANAYNDTSPVWSPDGRRIAFVSDRDGSREIYVMNADGNEQLNLSRNPAEDWTPAWSPDGKRLAFGSFRDGNWEIYVMNADGSSPTRLTRNNAADYSPAWSPDGQRLAFVSNRDGNLDIYTMDADGNNQRRFTDDKATDQYPAWSPDGKQLMWESYRDDNMEIYVANLDGSGLRNVSRDSTADDHGAAWSPWGRRIVFFSNRDDGWDLYALDLETGERTNLTMSEAQEQWPSWGP